MKAIRFPFGENVGANSGACANVSWTSLLPFGVIFQMFPLRENAILAPFGDQSGPLVHPAGRP